MKFKKKKAHQYKSIKNIELSGINLTKNMHVLHAENIKRKSR